MTGVKRVTQVAEGGLGTINYYEGIIQSTIRIKAGGRGDL